MPTTSLVPSPLNAIDFRLPTLSENVRSQSLSGGSSSSYGCKGTIPTKMLKAERRRACVALGISLTRTTFTSRGENMTSSAGVPAKTTADPTSTMRGPALERTRTPDEGTGAATRTVSTSSLIEGDQP